MRHLLKRQKATVRIGMRNCCANATKRHCMKFHDVVEFVVRLKSLMNATIAILEYNIDIHQALDSFGAYIAYDMYVLNRWPAS